MKRLMTITALSLILSSCVSSPTSTPSSGPSSETLQKPTVNTSLTDLQNLNVGNMQFATDIYQKLSQDPENQGENIFISPLSISTAFGLAYAGSKGNTAQEMASVLQYNLPESRLHPAMKELLSLAEDQGKGQVFNTANALFIEKTTVLEPDYVAITNTYYNAADTRVNFKSAPKTAINSINDWVKEKTRGLIPKTLTFTKDTYKTRNIMVNTAYLKANWSRPFSEGLTEIGEFTTPSEAIKTPLMHLTSKLPYVKNKGYASVILPYQGGAMSMMVILPDRPDGLPKLEAKLTPEFIDILIEDFKQDYETAKPYKVELTLPKIDLSDDYKLGPSLKAMGMIQAFSDSADFSGRIVAAKQPDGYSTKLGQVIHKTVLKVDEAGTEAAAVTAIDEIIITSAPRHKPKIVEFKADHPFLILIRHNETGAILFMGRINNPAGN